MFPREVAAAKQLVFDAKIRDEMANRCFRKCLIEQGVYFRVVVRSLVADLRSG